MGFSKDLFSSMGFDREISSDLAARTLLIGTRFWNIWENPRPSLLDPDLRLIQRVELLTCGRILTRIYGEI